MKKTRFIPYGYTMRDGHTVIQHDEADIIRYIFQSYMTHVPEAQRGGITIWGVRDDGSWLNDDKGDAYPLLFDDSGAMKPAFKAIYDLLLETTGTTSPKEE